MTHTTTEAARILGIARRTIIKHAARARLPKHGQVYIIDDDGLVWLRRSIDKEKENRMEKTYNIENLVPNLKRLRKAKDMSQYDFATEAGIREKNYWQYESGRALPPLDKLVLLANTHGFTIDELLRPA